MADSQVRVGGSGWTVFTWQGTRIAWARVLSDTTPAPVAGAQDIQPLDSEHPIEIITPRAVGSGTLRITLFELWDAPVWNQLAGLEGTNGILDIFKKQVQIGSITCQKIIKTPNGGFRTKNYYNCVVTDVNDSETVEIATMQMPKDLTIRYTHFKRIS
jgi:hypothetical protein